MAHAHVGTDARLVQWLSDWEQHPGKQGTFTDGLVPGWPVKTFQVGDQRVWFAKPCKDDAEVAQYRRPVGFIDFLGLCTQDIYLMVNCHLIDKYAWKKHDSLAAFPPIRSLASFFEGSHAS